MVPLLLFARYTQIACSSDKTNTPNTLWSPNTISYKAAISAYGKGYQWQQELLEPQVQLCHTPVRVAQSNACFATQVDPPEEEAAHDAENALEFL